MTILKQVLTLISILSIIIVFIALIGNMLSFYLFSKKKFKKTFFSFYFRVEIIFDSLFLLIAVNYSLENLFSIDFKILSNLTCKLYYYFADIVTPIGHWILVLVTIDRYLSIVSPSKFLFRNKKFFRLISCLVIVLFNLVFYIPDLIFYDLKLSYFDNLINNQTIIESKFICVRDVVVLNYLNFLNDCLLPFIFIMIFTILLIKAIYISRKKSRSNQSTPPTSFNNNNKIKTKDARFAFTSIAVNLVFVCLTLPSYLTLMIGLYDYEIFVVIDSIFYFLYFCQFGSIFFVNYLTNVIFRNEFKSLIRMNNKSKSNS